MIWQLSFSKTRKRGRRNLCLPNVREFLDDLRVKRKKLASVGVDIEDYRSTILASLPFSLSNCASAQPAAARV